MLKGFVQFTAAGIFLLGLSSATADTLSFQYSPPTGKYLAEYQESGMSITTRTCPEAPPDALTKQHSTFEKHCRILLTHVSGTTALKVSEMGTSEYVFSMEGGEFDLEGFDVLELDGTGELVSPSGAMLRFNSYGESYSRFRTEPEPSPLRFTPTGPAWKGITWFILRDGGGSATIDNLVFTPKGGQP